MSKNIFKRGLKSLLNLGGYDVVNKKQFGNSSLADIKTILQPNSASILFDIGANIGQTAVEFADYFPESLTYSFEPDPGAFSKLTEQVKKYKRTKTYNIGFGHRAEKIQMNINTTSGGNSILPMSKKVNQFAEGDWAKKIDQREVEITTLNSFCDINNIKHIDLIKIDTQGYEMKIIEGGDKVITPSFTKAVFIEVLFVELYQQQAYFQDIYKILTERGFRLVGIYNSFRKIEPPHFLLWCDALFVSESIKVRV